MFCLQCLTLISVDPTLISVDPTLTFVGPTLVFVGLTLMFCGPTEIKFSSMQSVSILSSFNHSYSCLSCFSSQIDKAITNKLRERGWGRIIELYLACDKLVATYFTKLLIPWYRRNLQACWIQDTWASTITIPPPPPPPPATFPPL